MSSRLVLAALLVTSSAAVAQPTQPTQPTPTPDPAAPADATTVEPIGDPTPAPVAAPAPEPAKPDAPPAVSVTWDKGLLFQSADDRFEARLAFKTQLRLEVVRSLADGAETEGRFYLPRTRISLEGHVFGEQTRYKLELGIGDRGGFAFVRDGFAERQAGRVWLRMGQWKRPFSRQELNGDFSSTFNERSIANDLAGGGRDVGFAIHNDYEKSPEGVEWVVGVFNGFSGGNDRPRIATTCEQDPVTLEITCTNGPVQSFPTDFSPAVVARVGYNHGKVKGYQEVDLDGGPLRFGVAANYKVDLADLAKGGEASTAKNLSHGIGVDAIVKVAGFDASLGAYAMKLKAADMVFSGFVQGGYVVVPKTVQVAGRFAFADAGAETLLEARVAFNYFLTGHSVKVASDVGFLKLTGGGDPELQVRIMPQMTF